MWITSESLSLSTAPCQSTGE